MSVQNELLLLQRYNNEINIHLRLCAMTFRDDENYYATFSLLHDVQYCIKFEVYEVLK